MREDEDDDDDDDAGEKDGGVGWMVAWGSRRRR
jgi:hypothetical protein